MKSIGRIRFFAQNSSFNHIYNQYNLESRPGSTEGRKQKRVHGHLRLHWHRNDSSSCFKPSRPGAPVPAGPGPLLTHTRHLPFDKLVFSYHSLPINFSRNDRNVGGRLGHQHEFQPGRLAAPGQADDSDMVASPARAPVSGIHTYLTFLSQLSYILISIILKMYPNYPTYLVIYPIYPLHAYVADKQPR